MSNVIQFPIIAGVEITTDAEGRFNLNALHRASGGEKKKGPSYWLALDSTKGLIEELESQQSDPELSVSQTTGISVVTLQGRHGGTFAHELLAISYAGWISPAFQLKVNQVFLDYRTGRLMDEATADPSRMPENGQATRFVNAGRIFREALRILDAADRAKPARLELAGGLTSQATGLDLVGMLRDNGWEPPERNTAPGYVQRLQNHPWYELVAAWLEETGTQATTTDEVLAKALDKHPPFQRADQMTVAAVLRDLGYTKSRQSRQFGVGGKRPFVYVREDAA